MFGLFSFFKKKKETPEPQPQVEPQAQVRVQAEKASPDFGTLPDGPYVVTLKDEAADQEQSILVNLEVKHGPYTGAIITAKFSDDKARKVVGEQSDSYLAFLAFEAHQEAYELVEALDYSKEEANGEFIVNFADGFVQSTPPYDSGEVEQFIAAI